MGAVVLTLVTAACAGQKDSIDPIYDETSLVALTASQDISTSPFHKKGYMILMGERGVVDYLPHEGMRMGKIAWDRDGIFYPDKKYDNWVLSDGGVKRNPADRDALGEAIIRLGNGRYASLFNHGILPDGYSEILNISSLDHIESSVVNGRSLLTEHVESMSNCGNQVYGYANIDDENGNGIKTSLYRLYDGSTIGFDLVSDYPSLTTDGYMTIGSLPCFDHRMYTIGIYDDVKPYDGRPGNVESGGIAPSEELYRYPIVSELYGDKRYTYLMLEILDVESGERGMLPMKTADGKAILQGDNRSTYLMLDFGSLNNGELYWLHGNGQIFKTNTATGITSLVSDAVKASSDDPEFYRIQVVDQYFHVLHDPPGNDRSLELVTIDLDTHQVAHRLDLSSAYDVLHSDYHVVTSFAVNPSFKELTASSASTGSSP